MIYTGISLCILGASFIQHVNLLVLIFALMAAPYLLSLLITRQNLSRLRVRRHLPTEATAGEPFDVQIEITNHRRYSSAYGISVRDRIGARREQMRPLVLFAEIPPGCSRRHAFRAAIHQRGRYPLGPATALTSFPFGFFERRMEVADNQELIVFPRTGVLTQRWHAFSEMTFRASRSRRQAATRTQDQYHGLREFRRGDNPRHVHWRTSARRGELMVKEFEPEESLDTLLLLEPWLPKRPEPSAINAVELMVSFAASVCVALCRWPGTRLVLIIAGAKPFVRQGHTSRRLLADYLRELAVATGSPSADLTQCLEQRARLIRSRNLRTWVVSTRPAGPRMALLSDAANLGGSRSRLQYLNVSAGDLEPYFRIDPIHHEGSQV